MSQALRELRIPSQLFRMFQASGNGNGGNGGKRNKAQAPTKLWLKRDPGLESALQQTPTAKVASSADFGRHILHRVQHAAAVRKHFGDQRHGQLRWSTYIKRQKAYAAICKDFAGGNSNTVVAYGAAAAVSKATHPLQLSLCGQHSVDSVVCMIPMSFARAGCAVHARQP